MVPCRIPPVAGRNFVWVGEGLWTMDYGLWTMGALPPIPPVTFSLQLEKVTKESRRQTSFPLKSDACRLKVLNLPSAPLRASDTRTFLTPSSLLFRVTSVMAEKEKRLDHFLYPLRPDGHLPTGRLRLCFWL